MHPIRFRPVATTIFIGLTVSYLLCIALAQLFSWQMVTVWAPLLPGFVWPLTAVGFLIGLLWLIAYSLYIAALIVFPYNYLTRQHVT